jgi:hypothetical protein
MAIYNYIWGQNRVTDLLVMRSAGTTHVRSVEHHSNRSRKFARITGKELWLRSSTCSQTNSPMISRVLIAMNDPEMVERAIEYAVEAYPTAEVTVLHVIGEPTPMMGEAARIAIEGETLQMIEHHV